MRDTGLEITGSVPWGTHFCQFYQDKQDLIDILVPYFAAGLRQHEFCLWVTSEPLGVEEAKAALEAVVGDLEPYLRSGQLELLDYSEWYTRGGRFEAGRVLQGWVDKLTAAREQGFEGLRLTGNTFWLEQSDWQDFAEYEATVDGVIGEYRMLAICTYSLAKCGAPELLDVMANHAFALIKRGGEWQIVGRAGRARSEENLLKEKAFSEMAINSLPGVFYLFDENGTFLRWNRNFEEVTGYSSQEFAARHPLDLFEGEDKEQVAEAIGQAFASGKSSVEAELVCKDGRRIPYYFVGFRMVVDDVPYLIGSGVDITERKRAAEALEAQVRARAGELAEANEALTREVAERRRTEEELRATSIYARSLLEASLDPLVTISPEGRVTDVNEATVEATGIPRTVLIGTDFSEYFTEPEQAREGYRRVFAEGFVTDYPLTIRHRSGRLIDVLYNASVYRDVRGNVLGVFAAARDVTAQRQAAQYARSLIEASLDPLVTISPEGSITDVNEATVKVTGVPRAELIGTDFSDYFTEPEQARAGYRHVFSEGFVVDYPLTVRHRDGTLTDVLYNASVYRDVRGEVLGVFAAARDVTERKRAEEEVRRLNEELEARVEQRTAELSAANRELEAFTYSVSHDLRAPLRAMDGFSMALLEEYGAKLEGEATDYLARIRANSQRMAQLIDDLLQLSRVTRGEMRRTPVDISALARTTAEELREAEPAREVSLTIADGLRAEGDARLLQLVLRNLLANAWKFTAKHAAAHIEVGLTRHNGRPAFFVRDDGAGFDMTYVGKLFGVFQRLHGAGDFEGTGIGLATVQRIIHRHGGEVWAEGAPEQGATFYFTLPRMSSS